MLKGEDKTDVIKPSTINFLPRHVAGPQLQPVVLKIHGSFGVVVIPSDQLQLELLHGVPQHDVEELDVGVVGGTDLVHVLDHDVDIGAVLSPGRGQLNSGVIIGQLLYGVQKEPVSHELAQGLLVLVQHGLPHLQHTTVQLQRAEIWPVGFWLRLAG